MENTEQVKKRYEELKTGINNLNLGKARSETKKENYEKQKEAALDTIEKIAGTRDVEEARTKLKGLETKLQEKLKEAEDILNDPEAE